MSRRASRVAFSLLELLVVMAVIIIMVGLLIPTVGNFGRATALTNAGNTVANLAAFARQNSVSKGTMTALVLLGDQGATGDADFRSYYYRAFTLLEYEAPLNEPSTRTQAAAQGGIWKQIHKWETLPTGIVADATDLANCSFANPSYSPQRFPFTADSSQPNPPVRFHGVQVKDGPGFAARIFMPNGSLRNPDQPAQIRLVEGFWQGDRVIHTRPGGDQTIAANYYDIAVIGATGMTKLSRP